MMMRGEPLFDPLSYTRRGSGRRDRLTPAQIQQIERTVRRTPEVMVKVLPKGTNSLRSVKNHMAYISRRGQVDLTTDDGDRLHGKGIPDHLITDWDLELEALRDKSDLASSRPSAKLVHKVLFSMPPGTDPARVLSATRNFCREEFDLRHRYVMALHTDEPHPHVHVIVKAMSEQGERLHIRKETLRRWRVEFAHHLRELGVPANATPRYVRGEAKTHKPDGLHRAMMRGERIQARVRTGTAPDARQVAQGAWLGIAKMLDAERYPEIAAMARQFASSIPLPVRSNEAEAKRLGEYLGLLRAPIRERLVEERSR